jgi:hypothetical protein
MKAQIWVKTRNRGRDWAEYRHLDGKKRAAGSRLEETTGDALRGRSGCRKSRGILQFWIPMDFFPLEPFGSKKTAP